MESCSKPWPQTKNEYYVYRHKWHCESPPIWWHSRHFSRSCSYTLLIIRHIFKVVLCKKYFWNIHYNLQYSSIHVSPRVRIAWYRQHGRVITHQFLWGSQILDRILPLPLFHHVVHDEKLLAGLCTTTQVRGTAMAICKSVGTWSQQHTASIGLDCGPPLLWSSVSSYPVQPGPTT